MDCDAYVSATEPTQVDLICYVCGNRVIPGYPSSLKEHEKCARKRNGMLVIPVSLTVVKGFFEER